MGNGTGNGPKIDVSKVAPPPVYRSIEEQALLSLLRTADCLNRELQHKIKPWGITATQYNVLRILRGAHPRSLSCSAIGDRMITAEPDITRLLSRLKTQRLVLQHRDRTDRRQVLTQISASGLRLLGEMDAMIEQGPKDLIGPVGSASLTELIRLLDLVRKNCDGSAASPECDGGAGHDARVTRDALVE